MKRLMTVLAGAAMLAACGSAAAAVGRQVDHARSPGTGQAVAIDDEQLVRAGFQIRIQRAFGAIRAICLSWARVCRDERGLYNAAGVRNRAWDQGTGMRSPFVLLRSHRRTRFNTTVVDISGSEFARDAQRHG